MLDIVRDSTLGQLINHFSNSRLLPYPEERKGYLPDHKYIKGPTNLDLSAVYSIANEKEKKQDGVNVRKESLSQSQSQSQSESEQQTSVNNSPIISPSSTPPMMPTTTVGTDRINSETSTLCEMSPPSEEKDGKITKPADVYLPEDRSVSTCPFPSFSIIQLALYSQPSSFSPLSVLIPFLPKSIHTDHFVFTPTPQIRSLPRCICLARRPTSPSRRSS